MPSPILRVPTQQATSKPMLRCSTVITFEPLLIEAAGQDVTLLHAGRSSQDMHATYRAAILRDQLLDLARGRDSDAYDRAIDVQISRLRRKLDDGGGSELIRTIRSEGYMFTAKVVRTP